VPASKPRTKHRRARDDRSETHAEAVSDKEHQSDRSQSLTLTTGGLTLLSVLLSIGVTVGIAIAPWWAGALAGAATTVTLATIIKLATRAGRGPLARLAQWIIGHV
jgi:hypothetical protein